jgi:hypothetical protein
MPSRLRDVDHVAQPTSRASRTVATLSERSIASRTPTGRGTRCRSSSAATGRRRGDLERRVVERARERDRGQRVARLEPGDVDERLEHAAGLRRAWLQRSNCEVR